MNRGVVLSTDDARQLQQLKRDVDQLKAEIQRTPKREMNVVSTLIRWGKVGAATATGVNDATPNPVQWSYAIVEVVKVKTGYQADAWSTLTNGFSGTAYSLAEYGNDGTGRQMNGIDHDGADYPSGFKMRELQVGAIVPFIFIPAVQSNVLTLEAWILPWPNGEDGTC